MSEIGKGYTGVIKVVSNPDENGNLTISQIYPKNRDVDILIPSKEVYGGDSTHVYTSNEILSTIFGKFGQYISSSSKNCTSVKADTANYVQNRVNKASSVSMASITDCAEVAALSYYTSLTPDDVPVSISDNFYTKTRTYGNMYGGTNAENPFSYSVFKTTALQKKNSLSTYLSTSSVAKTASFASTADKAINDRNGLNIAANYYTTANTIATVSEAASVANSTGSTFAYNVGNVKIKYASSFQCNVASGSFNYYISSITKKIPADAILRFVGLVELNNEPGAYKGIDLYSTTPDKICNDRFLIIKNTDFSGVGTSKPVYEFDIFVVVPYSDDPVNSKINVKVRSLITGRTDMAPWYYDEYLTSSGEGTKITSGVGMMVGVTKNSDNTTATLQAIQGSSSLTTLGAKLLIFRF